MCKFYYYNFHVLAQMSKIEGIIAGGLNSCAKSFRLTCWPINMKLRKVDIIEQDVGKMDFWIEVHPFMSSLLKPPQEQPKWLPALNLYRYLFSIWGKEWWSYVFGVGREDLEAVSAKMTLHCSFLERFLLCWSKELADKINSELDIDQRIYPEKTAKMTWCTPLNICVDKDQKM